MIGARGARAARGCACAAARTPWETLTWAITEQLIEHRARDGDPAPAGRARFGRRCPRAGLRDCADARRAIAAQAPGASSRRCGLAPKRALALRRAAREVGRAAAIDLADRERAWPRLLAIPEIGAVDGRDARAARARARSTSSRPATSATSSWSGGCTTGHPKARADEAEVRGFFAPYAPWTGLAGAYLRAARELTVASLGQPSPGQELVGQRRRLATAAA